MENTERREYEVPALIDYGTVEEVTKGALPFGNTDLPIGSKTITPTTAPTNSSAIR